MSIVEMFSLNNKREVKKLRIEDSTPCSPAGAGAGADAGAGAGAGAGADVGSYTTEQQALECQTNNVSDAINDACKNTDVKHENEPLQDSREPLTTEMNDKSRMNGSDHDNDDKMLTDDIRNDENDIKDDKMLIDDILRFDDSEDELKEDFEGFPRAKRQKTSECSRLELLIIYKHYKYL